MVKANVAIQIHSNLTPPIDHGESTKGSILSMTCRGTKLEHVILRLMVHLVDDLLVASSSI